MSTPLQPTVEDYHSDTSENAKTRRKNANVSAKRSNPSDLGKDKPVEVPGPDFASDSGYSSHSRATMSSADSNKRSPPATTRPAPVRVDRAATSNVSSTSSKTRKPATVVDTKNTSGKESPKKGPSRTGSQTQRPRADARREPECTEPNCKECRKARKQQRPELTPLERPMDVNCPPFTAHPQRSPEKTVPPSPQRPPMPGAFPPANSRMEPAQTHTRRRASSTSRQRPLSYYDGAPAEAYYAPSPYGAPVINQRGPPPSMSAYTNPPMQPYPSPFGQTPPNAGYWPTAPLTPSSPYDTRAAPLYDADQYSTRRAALPTPTVIHQQFTTHPQSSATAPISSARRYEEAPPPQHVEYYESSGEEYERREDDYPYPQRQDDRALMPPPAMIPSRRNSVHRPQPPDVARGRLRYDEDPRYDYDYQTSYPVGSSRASSNRRPSLASSNRTKATSYSNSSGSARVTVESSGANSRRISYMGHEQRGEVEDKRASFYEGFYEGAMARGKELGPPLRQNDEDRRRKETVDKKARDIEEYQRSKRGNRDPEMLTAESLRAQQRGATSSSRSSGGSKVSGSGRTTATRTENGDLKLRLDASTGVNLELLGDMEGKTLSIRAQEDGMHELVIGSARGDKSYDGGSTRSSVTRKTSRRGTATETVRPTGRRRTNTDYTRYGQYQ